MLALSVTVATYAVLQGSTAVVIGAMLIAPLMVPMLGLAGVAPIAWTSPAWASEVTLLWVTSPPPPPRARSHAFDPGPARSPAVPGRGV